MNLILAEKASDVDLLKNTARFIFNTHRMDLSETSMRALEAKLLAYNREEVTDLTLIFRKLRKC